MFRNIKQTKKTQTSIVPIFFPNSIANHFSPLMWPSFTRKWFVYDNSIVYFFMKENTGNCIVVVSWSAWALKVKKTKEKIKKQ